MDTEEKFDRRAFLRNRVDKNDYIVRRQYEKQLARNAALGKPAPEPDSDEDWELWFNADILAERPSRGYARTKGLEWKTEYSPQIRMHTRITLPPGEYLVGDPCYSVASEDGDREVTPRVRSTWHQWLADADIFADPGEIGSHLRQGRLADVYFADVDGLPVVGVNTATGDGGYADQFGNVYGVDAGLIGVVDVRLLDTPKGKDPGSGATRHTFDEPFDVWYERRGGIIHIGHLEIPTGDEFGDWEEREASTPKSLVEHLRAAASQWDPEYDPDYDYTDEATALARVVQDWIDDQEKDE